MQGRHEASPHPCPFIAQHRRVTGFTGPPVADGRAKVPVQRPPSHRTRERRRLTENASGLSRAAVAANSSRCTVHNRSARAPSITATGLLSPDTLALMQEPKAVGGGLRGKHTRERSDARALHKRLFAWVCAPQTLPAAPKQRRQRRCVKSSQSFNKLSQTG